MSRLVLPAATSLATIAAALEQTAAASGVGYAAAKAFLKVTLAHLHSACRQAGLGTPKRRGSSDAAHVAPAARIVARIALLTCRLAGRDSDKELLKAFAELCVSVRQYRLALALIDRVVSGPSTYVAPQLRCFRQHVCCG